MERMPNWRDKLSVLVFFPFKKVSLGDKFVFFGGDFRMLGDSIWYTHTHTRKTNDFVETD